MKEIPLRNKKHEIVAYALVDDSDFEWLMQWKWHRQIDAHTSYAVRQETINGKRVGFKMHRVILGLTDPKIKGDHRNHNGLDNQRHNLRRGTQKNNGANRTSNRGSSSKYLGVSYWISEVERTLKNGTKKKYRYEAWQSSIEKDGIGYSLGKHNTEEDAARAYDKKAMELHGEFANLNFKEEAPTDLIGT